MAEVFGGVMLNPVNLLVFMLYVCSTVAVVHANVGIFRTMYARWGVADMNPRRAGATKMIAFDYAGRYNPWESPARGFMRRITVFLVVALVCALVRGICRGIAAHMDNPWMWWTLFDDAAVVFIHDEAAFLVMWTCAIYLGLYRHPWRS